MSTPLPASELVAKVTDVDHLADLTYNISSVIGHRYTAGDNEILTLLSLKRENKIWRRSRERKLRKLALMRKNQRLDFEDKLYLAKINNISDTAWGGVVNHKTFTNSPFTGSSSLTSFIDNLRMEIVARQGWEKLVRVLTRNSVRIQLLGRFNLISEEEMRKEKTSRTPKEYNMSKNMYIAVWRSLSSALKREMKAIGKQYDATDRRFYGTFLSTTTTWRNKQCVRRCQKWITFKQRSMSSATELLINLQRT